MNMKLMTAGMVAVIGFSAFCGGIQISNVQAKQRSKDTGMVDVTFDVTSSSNTVSVILSALNTDNNATVKMNAVYDADGNFLGNPAKIEPGKGRELVWNSALDLGKGFYSSSMVVTVRATEYDLPPSRIKRYIDGKEAEGQLLEEARTNAVASLARATEALALAKTNTINAAAAVEAVTYQNLKRAEIEAAAEVARCEAALAASNAVYDATNVIYLCSSEAYKTALNDSTNCAWAVTYKNSSGDSMTITGKGAAELVVQIEKFETFTLMQVETTTPSASLLAFWLTWADAKTYAQGLITTATEAKAKKDADGENLEKAAQDVMVAKVNLVHAQDAYAAAVNDLNNIFLLQFTAAQQLKNAQIAEARAQKAYDDAKKACEELGLL